MPPYWLKLRLPKVHYLEVNLYIYWVTHIFNTISWLTLFQFKNKFVFLYYILSMSVHSLAQASIPHFTISWHINLNWLKTDLYTCKWSGRTVFFLYCINYLDQVRYLSDFKLPLHMDLYIQTQSKQVIPIEIRTYLIIILKQIFRNVIKWAE